MMKVCAICKKKLSKSQFSAGRKDCKSCHSRAVRITVMHNGKTSIVIPYDPVGDKAMVSGFDIRLARALGGIRTTYHMASFCGWSQTCQVRYERLDQHLIAVENIWKMIRVCNGEK